MLVKLTASIFFITIGGVVGFSLADKLRSERRICNELAHLLQRTSFLIGYRADDVYSVCSELKRDSELRGLSFLGALPERFEVGSDFRKCWNEAVSSQSFQSEERDILLRLGAVLGKSDRQSQVESIRQLQTELAALTEKRSSDYLRKGRLYRSVGLLFGVMAGILVI